MLSTYKYMRKVRKMDKQFKKDIKRFDRLMEYAQKMANYEIPADTPMPK